MERLVDSVKQKATAQLDTQKGRATDTISVIATAVRGTTNQLRNEHHDVLAGYVENVADQLDRLSTSLRDQDIGQLVAGARQMARRQPALFIGGSFIVGLAAARFLKSSRGDQIRPPSGQAFGASGSSPAPATDYPARDNVRDWSQSSSEPADAGRL